MAEDVRLTHDGGWKELHEIRYSVSFSNILKVIEIIILFAILCKLCSS